MLSSQLHLPKEDFFRTLASSFWADFPTQIVPTTYPVGLTATFLWPTTCPQISYSLWLYLCVVFKNATVFAVTLRKHVSSVFTLLAIVYKFLLGTHSCKVSLKLPLVKGSTSHLSVKRSLQPGKWILKLFTKKIFFFLFFFYITCEISNF